MQWILRLNSFSTLELFESACVLVAVVSSLHRLPVRLRAIRSEQHPIWRLCQLKRQMDERDREGTLRSPAKRLHCRRNSPRLPEDASATQTETDFLKPQQIDFPSYRWQLFWWLLTGYFQPDVAKMRLCQPLTYEVCVLFFAIMKVNWMSWRISVCFLKLWETPFLTVLIYFRI